MRTIGLLLLALTSVATAAPGPGSAQPGPPKVPAARANAVKVTILSTMLAGDVDAGVGEWGFAALLEVDGKRLLVDTGARPETVLKNAAELKVDLATVTDVVLTHAHPDHTGGLVTLRRELQKQQPTALSKAHVGKDFFATRVRTDGSTDDNGGLRKAYEALGGSFVEHAGPVELVPNVWFTGPVPRPNNERNWTPRGKIRRDAKTLVEDTVPEDSSIVVDMPEGLLVVTGCGHAGIVNISEYARKLRGADKRIEAVVGGLHLFNQSDDQVAWTGRKLKELGVHFLLGAHCTGIEAVFRLRDLLGLARATAVVGAVGASFTRGKGIDPRALAH